MKYFGLSAGVYIYIEFSNSFATFLITNVFSCVFMSNLIFVHVFFVARTPQEKEINERVLSNDNQTWPLRILVSKLPVFRVTCSRVFCQVTVSYITWAQFIFLGKKMSALNLRNKQFCIELMARNENCEYSLGIWK